MGSHTHGPAERTHRCTETPTLMHTRISIPPPVSHRTHHCQSRRLLQRPWRADAELTDIIETLILAKTSIAQRIRNSDVHKSAFNREIKIMDECPVSASSAARLVNLSNAKHRFDSVSTPLIRLIALLPAVLSCAYNMFVERSGQAESRDAAAFLRYVSGVDGMRRLVLAALVADAASACVALLRFYDTESYDAANVCAAIRTYADKLHCLFTEGRAHKIQNTYTQRMVRHLGRTRTFIIGRTSITVGSAAGVPTAVIDAGYASLCAFATLSVATLKAEFPEWETLQSFCALDLAATTLAPHERNTALHRLAHVFDLPLNQLITELEAVLPRARQQRCGNPDSDNLEWRLAWENKPKREGGWAAVTALLVRAHF